jgi:hypothetical protein
MKTPLVLALSIGALAVAPSADARLRGCGHVGGYYVSANPNTSCPFAKNVARGFVHGNRNPAAWSPATHRVVQMHCKPRGTRSWACRGGNNAFVGLTFGA